MIFWCIHCNFKQPVSILFSLFLLHHVRWQPTYPDIPYILYGEWRFSSSSFRIVLIFGRKYQFDRSIYHTTKKKLNEEIKSKRTYGRHYLLTTLKYRKHCLPMKTVNFLRRNVWHTRVCRLPINYVCKSGCQF